MGTTETVIAGLAVVGVFGIVAAIETAAKRISQAISSLPPINPYDHSELVDELSQMREQLERISRKMRGEADPPTLGGILGEALATKPKVSRKSDQAKS
jgi:hypothetical protein